MPEKMQTAWEWARWLLPIILIWGGRELLALRADIHSLSERVVAIESNRFTSADGLELWRALGERPERSEVPPVWFKERVDALEARLTRIEALARAGAD